jgi:hypothetical protein
MKCITWRLGWGGFGHVSCPTRVDGICTQEMQEGIAQRRDTRDDTLAYRSEEGRKQFKFHWIAFKIFRLLILISKINLLTSHP